MRVIGYAAGIPLEIPRDAYLSFFNSPYIGHELGSAIDVYPANSEWNGAAFSPVSGEIVKIRKVQMGKTRSFPTDDYDYGIAIRPEDEEDKIVRILHSQPSVQVGDKVEAGDEIGYLIRSRYFNYWTGPHYHVEVMDLTNFKRSSKSYPLVLRQQDINITKSRMADELICEVASVTDDILIATSKHLGFVHYGNMIGHVANSYRETPLGLIDAGIPHYKFGSIIGDFSTIARNEVWIWDQIVGDVERSILGQTVFRTFKYGRPYVDEFPALGISYHIYSKRQAIRDRPPLFIIPPHRGAFNKLLRDGDIFTLSFRSNPS